MIGTTFAHYRITAALGAGGMGEVWRAEDTKLGREVALKILPKEFALNPDRVARFDREAKLLASLNHPNIAHLYGLETIAASGSGSEPTTFLVMELVEGEDLAQRLSRGAIPPDETIEIATRIAEALEEAHENGIVHRDLKPANVKLSPDGKVKVLDFGLAKAFTSSTSSGDAPELSQSPTLIESVTQAGVILGTAAYMSPEQARGKAVDRRTDIWAFGAVVWEMLTGRSLFAGETVSDIVAAVLTREPDWSDLPADTPGHLRRLLRRCLVRDARQRLQAIGDARIELEGAPVGEPDVSGAINAAATPAVSAGRGWGMTATIAVIAVAIAIAATIALRPGPTTSAPAVSAGTISFSMEPPAEHRYTGGLALSPDGLALAFVARDPEGQTAIWVRALDTVEPRRIANTEGAMYPFWSPDGRRIGFFAGGNLRIVDLVGEAVTNIVRTSSSTEVRGAAWSADDVIVYAPSYTGGLFRVAAAGGEPAKLTQLDIARKDGTHRWPHFLPDGRHFIYYASPGSGIEPGELRLGSLDSDIAQTLTASHSKAIFMPPHYALFVRGTSLVAQQIDLERLELVGNPRSTGISLPGSMDVSGSRYLTSGGSRTIAHRLQAGDSTRLVWFDRAGRELAVVVDDGAWHVTPLISPDGSRISVSHYDYDGGAGDIHIRDTERQLDTRVTYSEADDQQAVWSPDGRLLAISTISTDEPSTTYIVDPSRPGERQPRWRADTLTWVEDWFPDGGLLLSVMSEEDRSDLFRLPPDDGADLVPIVVSPFADYGAELSSDGLWLAYVSDSTGRAEVYVRAIGSGEQWRVSKAGGSGPKWRGDDKELYYVDSRGFIIAIPTTLGDNFSMGSPEALFEAMLDQTAGRQYDVTADGQRFILNLPMETGEQAIIITIDLPEEVLAGRGR